MECRGERDPVQGVARLLHVRARGARGRRLRRHPLDVRGPGPS